MTVPSGRVRIGWTGGTFLETTILGIARLDHTDRLILSDLETPAIDLGSVSTITDEDGTVWGVGGRREENITPLDIDDILARLRGLMRALPIMGPDGKMPAGVRVGRSAPKDDSMASGRPRGRVGTKDTEPTPVTTEE